MRPKRTCHCHTGPLGLACSRASQVDTQRQHELSVVIPAYNEAEGITQVLAQWTTQLDQLSIDYELLVYDDGSTDKTGVILEQLAGSNPRLRVIRHSNRGHGPTILKAYHEATGKWVLQIDGDGEIPADQFSRLWEKREAFDFLLGYRQGRESAVARQIITKCSRLTVALLFGRSVEDVNTPFRLMLNQSLKPLLVHLPSNTFAPNVILSGLAGRAGLRIHEEPVSHQGRLAGVTLLVKWALVRAALDSFVQTVAVAYKARRAIRRK